MTMEKKNIAEVDRSVIDDLNEYKNKLLFSKQSNTFIIIKDFDYQEELVTKKKFWSREEVKYKKYYITKAIMAIWQEGKWKVLSYKGVEWFFNPLVYVSPREMRGDYLFDIKAPLESLGAVFINKNVNE